MGRGSPNVNNENLEKSGFDDEGTGRDGGERWWRRWLRGGCFGR